MDRFQIVELTTQFNHAGTKATADISVIAEKMGFKRLNLKMRTTKNGYFAKVQRQIGYYQDWNICYNNITDGSVVLLQHPFHYPQVTRKKHLYNLKKKKYIKFISVVHDVEELRAFRFNDYYKSEFEVMLDIADIIIVHNRVMKQYFIERGIDNNKLIDLEIFDYLQDNMNNKTILYEKAITIAGNLDTMKCQYIAQLGELKGVKVNLYGPNFNKDMELFENIKYYGSFSVDQIPNQLNAGFGLVWDGESIHGCKGLSGQYLKYNNPHKLSLYLSSGIPVVIWSGVAEASFVKENGVGICVESLTELTNIFATLTEEKYITMTNRIKILSQKLKMGMFTQKAINDAMIRI